MSETTEYPIRLIQPSDAVGSFKTGQENFRPLKNFLKYHAYDYQAAMVASTYVATKLNHQTGKDMIVGYITLTCSEVDLRNGYELDDCTHANRYDSLPAVKIARLAVDSRYRRQGIGDNLVGLAVAIAVDEVAPLIGCRFLITDAKTEAVSFYDRQGFTFLDTEENRKSSTPIMFLDLSHI